MSAHPAPGRLAVLAFHKIGAPPPDGWDTCHYVPAAVFTAQLAWIRESGWSVLDIETFLAGLEAPERLPERGMLLTFDDAHRSFREVALPVLGGFGFPAECFVPTGFIGGRSTFDRGVEPEEPICGWDDLREIERHGVAVQSHGVSHTWLSLLDEERRDRELVESKRALEEGLARPVLLFAYPYSDAGGAPRVLDGPLARAGYRAAFLCGGGPPSNPLPIREPFRLSRLAIYRESRLDDELGA